MALDFTPLEEVTVDDFLGEFPASQAHALAEKIAPIVEAINNFRENAELRGTAKMLAEKPEPVE